MQKNKHAYHLLVSAAIVWGLSPIVYKISLGLTTVLVFLAGRFLFGAIAIFITNRRRFNRLPKGLYLPVFIISIFNGIVINYIYAAAVQNTSILHIAIISLLTPFLIYAFANIILKEKIHHIVIIGATISSLGLLTIILSNPTQGQYGVKGDLFMFAYIAINALLIVFARKLLSKKKYKIHPEQLSFIEYLTSGIILSAILVYNFYANGAVSLSINIFIACVIAGTIFGAMPLILYYRAARRLPAEKLADTNLISPFIAVLSGVLFYQEQLTTEAIIGGLLLVIGLLISNKKLNPVYIAHQLYMEEQVLIRAFRQPRKAYEHITNRFKE